jgi:DNA-binding beta-propeller fold protein YncE
LYSRSIHILNPQNCSLTGNIATGGWTEEMILAGGKVFATQTGTDQLLVIDPASDQIVDSLTVGREPNSLVQDASGMIWVLCSGGLGETNSTLVKVDPLNLAVSGAVTFSNLNSSPDRLRIDPAGERIYWVEDGKVMSLETGSAQALPQVFAAARGGQFYGLGVDPVSGAVYVGDARDYVREGLVYGFTPAGMLLDSFVVGVIPGSFAFD